ncbi:MAG: alpha/beta hydrolase [Isosphaeraceae bacterium]
MAQANGTELAYDDEGSGHPLVLVPGLGATRAMFGPQVDAFRSTHRLILPDLRGTGQSGRLRRPIRTVIDRQCDDLAALLDHLKIDRTVMVGVSYGGAVALHFALRHPRRLAGLVAVDTFADLRISHPMEALLLVGSYLTLPAYYLPRPVLRGAMQAFCRRWPEARRQIPALVDSFRPTEAILQSVAMCRIDDTRLLGRVDCPTLGIVGDATRTGVRLMQRAMAAIPGAVLEVLPDSFDPSNLCQPEAFNRRLAAFLRRIGW